MAKLSMQELLAKARADKQRKEQGHGYSDDNGFSTKPSTNSTPTGSNSGSSQGSTKDRKPAKLDIKALILQMRTGKQQGTTSIKPTMGSAGNDIRVDTSSAVPSTAINSSTSEVHSKPRTEPVASNSLSKIEQLKQQILAKKNLTKKEQRQVTKVVTELATSQSAGMHGEVITYNEQQRRAVQLGREGKSFVLIGSAGTGKTTCSNGVTQGLIDSGKVAVLNSDGHKYLVSGTPGILIVSYTRRAVNNIKKVQSTELQQNCLTVHKLLEYQPEEFEINDPETGKVKKSMRFVPSRNEINVLPDTIHTIIVEEASMLSLELYEELAKALPHGVQWIFIGDIQQLPPVFGSAILGFKMLELPVVQLTEVYRQALESPIIRLAQRVLSGKPIPAEEYPEWRVPDKLTIHPWKKKLSPELACKTLAAFFRQAETNGVYDPYEDIILIPYNKGCGTIELNKEIANHLARKRNEVTYEVMAGFNKHYFSVGDRILYDREDAEIVSIEPNSVYTGARVQKPSRNLDYWGYNPKADEERGSEDGDLFDDEIDIDAVLDAVSSDNDERVTQASHKVTVQLLDSGDTIELTKAAAINSILLSYALTVHKSQGSEWRKVFFCLHQSHATMLQRELLYTGITRAREELYVICEPETFTSGINSQKIKGDSLEDKIEFFKGKARNGDYDCDY